MPVILPPRLPALADLRAEGLAVWSADDRPAPNSRPLRILLLNLMPDKPATERQIARLLAAAPQWSEVTLCVPRSYCAKTTPAEHLRAFYSTWDQIRDRRFDGLIVTGAPVETLPFEEVTYWPELTAILDWARTNVLRSYFICWAAQAALHHYHGVRKHALPRKLSGVYRHRLVDRTSPLVEGLESSFPVPVSRHSEVRKADLPAAAGLMVIADSREAGLCLIEERRRGAVYMFDHLEYEAETLKNEYLRDRARGLPVRCPEHYLPGNDVSRAPRNRWRSVAERLSGNWLADIARARARHEAGAALLDWMLDWRPGRSCGLLIECRDGSALLPALLRLLDGEAAAPNALRVRPLGADCSAVELEIGARSGPELQRLAERVVHDLPASRVSFRSASGCGGLLWSRERSAATALDSAERPAARSA